ncbi:MAG: rhomboid family intramembrane serine protease [Acidobacteria bacterium]|nr:rhomboid family intramembrane serine protease [Acidobacteriota bacterium]MBV9474694.1 rhomboid family intramembrane serine protease [Acidobacteriota bacterium]
MFRSRGENLRSVFVLLFLYVAFFLLEHQDPRKFSALFRFDLGLVTHGQWWRVVTYQFTQAGEGWVEALSLFVTLLLVYMMGSAVEEEWGTRHFVTLFAISTLTTAGCAAWLGVPLLGSYFPYFTLLFVYASAFPQQTFYLMGVVAVRVRVLAVLALAVLVWGAFSGGASNVAALTGALAAYAYYLTQRVRVVAPPPPPHPSLRLDTTAIQNGARYAAIRQALAAGADAELERLMTWCEREIVPNVNICPPADYKPENADGYCIRCEGFAECSARYLRTQRAKSVRPPLVVPQVPHPDAP